MTVKIDGTNTVANPAFTGADTDTGLQCGTNELKLVTGGNTRATVDSLGDVKLEHKVRFQYNADSTDSRTWLVQNDLHAYGDLGFRRSTNQTGNTFETKILFKDTGGICFNGDTAAANALDDYEEGDWTPTVKGQGSAGTASYSQQHGKYTKIGNRVIVNGYVDWSSANGTGGLLIAGLPELSVNHAYRGIQSGSAMTSGITFPSGATSVTAYLPQNSNEMQIYISGSGQTWANLPIPAAGGIIFQLTYVTAT